MASHDQILTNNLRILASVSADDTAHVIIHNPTASAVTVAAGTVSVLVFPGIGNWLTDVLVRAYLVPGSGYPEAGVTVSLTLDGAVWGSAVTALGDAFGGTDAYAYFPNVPPGAVVASATYTSGGDDYTGSESGSHTLAQDTALVLQLNLATSTVNVTVYMQYGTTPIEGATVDLSSAPTSPQITNASGVATFTSVPAGAVLASTTANGGGSDTDTVVPPTTLEMTIVTMGGA